MLLLLYAGGANLDIPVLALDLGSSILTGVTDASSLWLSKYESIVVDLVSHI